VILSGDLLDITTPNSDYGKVTGTREASWFSRYFALSQKRLGGFLSARGELEIQTFVNWLLLSSTVFLANILSAPISYKGSKVHNTSHYNNSTRQV
jgi:hypothetical protein